MVSRPRAAARLHEVVAASPAARGAARGLAQWLARVAPRQARGEVSIALVSDARMRALNRDFRGVDHATDVLSFPAVAPEVRGRAAGRAAATRATTARASGTAARGESDALGDLAIATGVAARQAAAAGHSLRTELRVLALHGLLHLLGFDHDAGGDHGLMARTEARLRRAGGLREGLIERARPTRARAATAATAARPVRKTRKAASRP